ncbi:MAG: hypothetical protein EBE86_018630, partial [Hormoscilla sp. GUM202]|nr:hypothetical protein [Hormoscilla sp. GUM202]
MNNHQISKTNDLNQLRGMDEKDILTLSQLEAFLARVPSTSEENDLLDVNDYAALRALYTSTNGSNWKKKTGWDFSSETPPPAEVVSDWHGVTVEEGRVTKIELNRNNLSGMLPSELGDLSNLQKLRLQSNALSGTIPSELGSLGNLQDLGLYNNSLSGTLPSWIVSISDLQFLGLSKNDFHGTVPSEYSELGNLRQLGLAQNSLSGTLPS